MTPPGRWCAKPQKLSKGMTEGTPALNTPYAPRRPHLQLLRGGGLRRHRHNYRGITERQLGSRGLRAREARSSGAGGGAVGQVMRPGAVTRNSHGCYDSPVGAIRRFFLFALHTVVIKQYVQFSPYFPPAECANIIKIQRSALLGKTAYLLKA